jgi:outer membrane protein insertion porin family
MRSPSKSSALIFPLALTLATSWGQPSLSAEVQRYRGAGETRGEGEQRESFTNYQLPITSYQSKIQNLKSKFPTIASIRVRFLDRKGLPTRGRTRPFIITREFDLQPGDVYNQKLAQQGLQRVSDLNSVRRASITLKPTIDPNRAIMVVNVVERSSLTANLDTGAPAPAALQGPFQPQPVSPGANIDSGFSVGGSLQLRNLGGNNQSLALRVVGGEQVLNGELSFTDPWIAGDRHRTGYTVNVFNQRAVQSVFTGGDRDINLPGGDNPWVHRLGGGVQFFRPLAPDLIAALGLSYQQVSVRDDMFSSKLQPRDEQNNPLTFSDSGKDDLLTLNFSTELDRRNDRDNPTHGSRLLLGIDQSIPVGEANILFTRLSANYLQYIPLPLFSFTKGPRTLILNLQAGTMLGDVPGYEAFNLGAGLTRGFSGNAIGTGRSFVEATAEYHFPISIFQLFEQPVDLGGALFVDYTSDLNTASSVLGDPAIIRDKPGNGLGYGVGLRAKTSFGTARLEFAWSEGESQVIFTLGDRF